MHRRYDWSWLVGLVAVLGAGVSRRIVDPEGGRLQRSHRHHRASPARGDDGGLHGRAGRPFVERTSGGQGVDDSASPSKQWYFTLERSVSFESDSSTSTRPVFGGWDGNTHLNFGTGPPPKISAFRKRIEQKIQPSDE